MTKKPRTSEKTRKRGALEMGTPGDPVKAEAKGFATWPPGPPGAKAQAKVVAQWRPQTSSFFHQPSTPPLNAAVQSTTGPVQPPFVPSEVVVPPLATAGSAPITVTSNVTAWSMAAVESRLSREPAAIRDSARNLSQEFASQGEDLRRSRPNDERLAQHDDLIAFVERMAA